jgi:conjugal transfer pilin signal peptidase TrbI
MSLNPFVRLTRKEASTLFLLALVAGVIEWWLPGRLNVVVSGSLKHRIFFLCQPTAKIETGDYLVFKFDDFSSMQKSLTKHNLLTKEVGCAPGDILTVDEDRRFMCNGEPLGQALKTDSRGDILPLFSFNGVIPPDNYFTIGSNPRSFDSKYIGFIKKDEIVYRAYPIW